MCLNNLVIILNQRPFTSIAILHFCETESLKLEMQSSCENVDLTIVFVQKIIFFENRTHQFLFEKNAQVVLVY